MDNVKVLFLMTTRYPTRKAYGVTTGESVRALREMGHDAKILSFADKVSKVIKDQYGNEVIVVFAKWKKAFQNSFFENKFFGPLLFILKSIVLSIIASNSISVSRSEVVWSRDVFSILVLALRNPKVFYVIELHHAPSSMERVILKYMLSRRKIIILAIQKSMKEKLDIEFTRVKILLAPMAVSNRFIDKGKSLLGNRTKDPVLGPLRVCYLGRATSAGESNGVEQLIRDWEMVPSELAELVVVGLTPSDLSIKLETTLRRIRFIEHIEHLDVPNLLAEFDCGIVPYPESPYNRERFPIKVIEYCALGLNLIITDTRAHRELVDEHIGYFYRPGSSESLEQNLVELRSNRKIAHRKAENGFKWAQGYTYMDRVRETVSILEEFQD